MRDECIDVLPSDARWQHAKGPGAHGIQLHYVRQGTGTKVLLLHGWPGFWYDWRRVIPTLSANADVIAPDFRGFGNSDKPDVPPTEGYTPEVLAEDILTLLNHLEINKVILVAHDIGATVAQRIARKAPNRVESLVLCNPPYPGIGERRYQPSAQREFWYQHLHNLPLAEKLIGYNRDTVRLYLAHFYDHWVGRKEAIRPHEFEAIVDMYAKPGAIKGSISYYQARNAARSAESTSMSADSKIIHPTFVLWGEADPVIPSLWSDRLGEYFERFTLRVLPGIGHFVPIEAPRETLEAIFAALNQR
ncbi:hydrolase [Collibacillus ludicampi]|uniref:Hydrolase n=1 Tax=Collibacillus ludicampi TaxID=2771369 RepID=A0AAV4LEU0_9BACL|nr:alpha/beta hydrolase [Collibacillus ludicampi]GIM46189.1 hydrolase [Collibacillus ludicampi]